MCCGSGCELSAEPVLDEDKTSARFLSSYHWTKERADFGGYSGLILSPDGASFVMMSDRAHVIEGTIFRHSNRIIGLRSSEMAPLDIPDSLFAHPSNRDTEGLARDADGRLFVSVESENLVLRRDLDGSWAALPRFPAIDALPSNRGLEALAISTDDTIYALPEVSRDLLAPFAVFRFRGDVGWDQPMSISRSDGFVPVGADVGPDGQLYILERGFSGFGFSSRVRRFEINETENAAGETLLTTSTRRHDNLEGLAVWRAEDGTIRLTIVSDDNFMSLQNTEIVEYAIGN